MFNVLTYLESLQQYLAKRGMKITREELEAHYHEVAGPGDFDPEDRIELNYDEPPTF